MSRKRTAFKVVTIALVRLPESTGIPSQQILAVNVILSEPHTYIDYKSTVFKNILY